MTIVTVKGGGETHILPTDSRFTACYRWFREQTQMSRATYATCPRCQKISLDTTGPVA
jgi:hypothetical protein